MFFANGTVPSAATGGQFPDVHSAYQRLEATAKYTFDEIWVCKMGWSGKVSARLRYLYERNGVQNWQNDFMQTYMFSTIPNSGYMTWMPWNNPNYNVHLLGGSLAFTWYSDGALSAQRLTRAIARPNVDQLFFAYRTGSAIARSDWMAPGYRNRSVSHPERYSKLLSVRQNVTWAACARCHGAINTSHPAGLECRMGALRRCTLPLRIHRCGRMTIAKLDEN